MPKRIALFGGSFNPPGKHHRSVAEALTEHFDEVIVLPCGPRPDKPGVNEIDVLHRAAMTDLTFRGLKRVRVEHFDLEHDSFTRNHELERIYGKQGEVWHVIGSDLIQGGAAGQSPIHQVWVHGPEIWKTFKFAVFTRPDFDFSPADLPPHHQLFNSKASGSSTEIRERIWRQQDFGHLVTPEVGNYMRRYGLYRGTPPVTSSCLKMDDPRPMVVYDERNPTAVELAQPYLKIADQDNPNCIVVIGGDGMMMQSLRHHWRLRLPFFGINAGHRGHLLNSREEARDPEFLTRPSRARLLPLLYVEVLDAEGKTHGLHAVNDTWVERAAGQAAWIEVKINGQPRLPKLVADGVLLATATGSNAYARSLGARPLSVDARELLLVASNSSEPVGWKSAPLSIDTVVEFRALDPEKRPIRGYVDGVELGRVVQSKIRVSRIAAVELAFSEDRDIAAKLSEYFFPSAVEKEKERERVG